MKNFIANGNVLDYVNIAGTTILSGSVVVVGAIVGIAATDIVPGAVGAVNIRGAFSLPKGSFAGIQGQRVYWDTVAGDVIAFGNANSVFIGTLYTSCQVGDAACTVNLVGADQPAQLPFYPAIGAAPTQANFNLLLTELMNSGFMARS
jgi:predicted RecA/RadA family phage recombinase